MKSSIKNNFYYQFHKNLLSHPDKLAFALYNPKGSDTRISYKQLADRVNQISTKMIKLGLAGKQILVLNSMGIDLVAGFLASLKIGAAPTICHTPTPASRTWSRLVTVALDSQCSGILADNSLKKAIVDTLLSDTALSKSNLINTDDIPAEANTLETSDISRATLAEIAAVSIDDLAFLQYTSGSTSSPKGNVITHGNLLANADICAKGFSVEKDSVLVNWMPAHHDFGLIGNILQTVYAGASCVLISPLALVRNPAVWLNAISDYRATITMSPVFAVDLCVRKIKDRDIQGCDLSSLKMFALAAEMININAVRKFTDRFTDYGFNASSFRAAYGLAEVTLLCTSTTNTTGIHGRNFSKQALSNNVLDETHIANRMVYIASCGVIQGQQQIVIVDEYTKTTLTDGQVGEVWVNGGNVAHGYWNKEKETEEGFRAFTAEGDGPFLRTGDLGSFIDGELYIVGRSKETLIIRGVNYYPYDIELSAQSVNENIRSFGGAVFDIGPEGEHQVVLVQEIDKVSDDGAYDFQTLGEAIAERVSLENGVILDQIYFVRPRYIPKTSSGKIQRRLCQQWCIEGKLNYIFHFKGKDTEHYATIKEEPTVVLDQLLGWLQSYAKQHISSGLMDERKTVPPHILKALGDKGIFGLQIPAEFGGLGFGNIEAAKVLATLGEIDRSLAVIATIQNTLVNESLIHSSNETMRLRYLPELAKGRLIAAFALTEPAAGTNPQFIETEVVQQQDETWLLNGEKIWIGNASWSEIIVVIAKKRDKFGQLLGTQAILLPTHTPGINVAGEHSTMGLKAMVQNSVVFTNVNVNGSDFLCDSDDGMRIAKLAMELGRIYVAATCQGALKLSTIMMNEYAQQRDIPSGKLSHLVESRRKLLDALIKSQVADHIIAIACATADATESRSVWSAIAKVIASEYLWQTVDDLVQMHGGRGYIESNGIPLLMRDARIFRILEGPTEALYQFIGSSFIAMPESVTSKIIEIYPRSFAGSELLQLENQANKKLASVKTNPALVAECRYQLGKLVCLIAVKCISSELSALGYIEIQGSSFLSSLDTEITELKTVLDPRFTPVEIHSGEHIDQMIRKFLGSITDHGIRPFEIATSMLGPRVSFATQERTGNISITNSILSSEQIGTSSNGAHTPEKKVIHVDINNKQLTKGYLVAQKAIEDWFQKYFKRTIEDLNASFFQMGMDSMDAMDLSGALSDNLNIEIDPSVVWSYTTVNKLAMFLAGKVETADDSNTPYTVAMND